MRQKVEKVVAEIRSLLQADGGDIELVEVTVDGTVKVRLRGFCPACRDSMMTLKDGVEKMLKEQVPEVREVKTVDS
jgi:Fe-S cluster biogenesis protein NfuA